MTNIDISKIIEDELQQLTKDRRPEELYKPIHYILTLGGKRLRPRLTLLSCSLFTDNISVAVPAALALEVFHNFTLIHDDIMDNAMLRRGKRTVHTLWNTNVAILSGDAMCILAYHLLAQTASDKLTHILPVFNDTALKVCEGQQYDMNYESIDRVSETEYLKMIELKTAVLLAACLKIGAIAGGAKMDEAQLLYEFGINLGLAFQLQDDLLDSFGSEKELGKEIGKDIASNKKTYLLIKALEKADKKQQEELNFLLSSPNVSVEEKIKRVKSIFISLEVDKDTQQAINAYLQKAIEYLEKVDASQNRKKELLYFVEKLNHRRF
ncbi:MAG: polyprenyl synthetase family protein [Bacteroidales bacterium]|nr:polyprenyl synthetase family protein [Bacteroidales bacterium]